MKDFGFDCKEPENNKTEISETFLEIVETLLTIAFVIGIFSLIPILYYVHHTSG